MVMPPPATRFADSPPDGAPPSERAAPSSGGAAVRVLWGAAWRTLGRHQIGSLVATAVDFGTMIAFVELLGISAVRATALGAALGGIANFSLGRTWIFRHQSGRLGGQAARYALVSAAGAGWNALGETVVHDRAHIQYIVARALVSIVVSLLWNYPMQREFVFHEGRAR
jgi:putative flippase GtrA